MKGTSLRAEVYTSFTWIWSLLWQFEYDSLLSKIEKLCFIAKSTNAAVIGICESKLDASKPVIVGTIYRPPSQNNLLQLLNGNINKINSAELMSFFSIFP